MNLSTNCSNIWNRYAISSAINYQIQPLIKLRVSVLAFFVML